MKRAVAELAEAKAIVAWRSDQPSAGSGLV